APTQAGSYPVSLGSLGRHVVERPAPVDVARHELRVIADPVDEMRLAPMLEAEPHRVETGDGRGTTGVLDLAVLPDATDVEPGVGTSIPGRPDHGRDAGRAQIERPHPLRELDCRRRVLRGFSDARGSDMSVDLVQQPSHAALRRTDGLAEVQPEQRVVAT